MKTFVMAAVLVVCSALTPQVGWSQNFTCQVMLTQVGTRGERSSSSPPQSIRKLEAQTERARKFTNFPLSIAEGTNLARMDHNQCVSKRDFEGGKFEGFLCLTLFGGSPSPTGGTSRQLTIHSMRGHYEWINFSGREKRVRAIATDGLSEVVVPIDPAGGEIKWYQSLPRESSRDSGIWMEMTCRTALLP